MHYSELQYRVPELEKPERDRPLDYLDQYCKVYNSFPTFQEDIQRFIQDSLYKDFRPENNPIHFRTYRQLKKLLDFAYVISQLLYSKKIDTTALTKQTLNTIRSYLNQTAIIPLSKLTGRQLQYPISVYIKFFNYAHLAEWHIHLEYLLECACTEDSFIELMEGKDAIKITSYLEGIFEATYVINAIHNADFPKAEPHESTS